MCEELGIIKVPEVGAVIGHGIQVAGDVVICHHVLVVGTGAGLVASEGRPRHLLMSPIHITTSELLPGCH